MKQSTIIGALIALIVLGVGVFALTRGGEDEATSTPEPTSTSRTTEPPAPMPPSPQPAPESSTSSDIIITYSDAGFSPKSSTIKSGGSVTVRNTSSRELEFASDPHPAHTQNRELNLDAIPSGQSKTFTPTKAGTWGFHNHLRAGDTGSLVVE